MFGLKIFVRVQTFQRVPPVLPCNFCHPENTKSIDMCKNIRCLKDDDDDDDELLRVEEEEVAPSDPCK